MKIQKIYIGGWFQRTTLHLTEIWNFLRYEKSDLDFTSQELSKARSLLEIQKVSREPGPFEYILLQTKIGITVRIYEDGLMILEKPVTIIAKDQKTVRDYYEKRLSKGISLLFSKGAPVPKELANIQTILPYILMTKNGSDQEIRALFKTQRQEVYSSTSSQQVSVYRSSGLIVINNLTNAAVARDIIESEIFFREFKTQLHRYLAIHRSIWEKIAEIKEQGSIRGTDIDAMRSRLTAYQKTVELIDARISQMGSYLSTRQKIADAQTIDRRLRPLFQYKFETLRDTHNYIMHLWEMTADYLESSMKLFDNLQAKSSKNAISSLQLITTIGVVAAIMGYLGSKKLPSFTSIGLLYFALLMCITWVLNSVVSRYFKRKQYAIKEKDVQKEL